MKYLLEQVIVFFNNSVASFSFKMPPKQESDLPTNQIHNWKIFQNQKSEKVFGWIKSKKEVDENGQEKGIIVYKIGFLNHDPDFKLSGEFKIIFQAH